MTISIKKAQGDIPVTILGIEGDLDASNYLDVISAAKDIYDGGGRNLIVDLSSLRFMSSSGLVALHSIALLMRGDETPDLESGWESLLSLDRDKGSGVQEYVKLLNPQSRVDRTLEMTGLKEYFEIYTDLETAILSFG